ncbi:hypothetical protein JX266_010307 [Neoarthrinium moseri]|nr:hypothetical protein JX266_010307 [Neoarthrinium moseri]
MSTQYDAIQAPYDEIRKTSISFIEQENVHGAIAPWIHGARVLDLACGSGFYTKEFVGWGARSVLGVDISSAMLAGARRAMDEAGLNASQVSFEQADCTRPAAYRGGPFDVVFGAWLLNYAGGAGALTDAFRNVAANLAEGGRFVGVTTAPTHDPAAFYAAENAARPRGSGLLMGRPTGPVDDGFAVHMHGDTDRGAVDFDFFHLRQDVYEAAARDAGLRGPLEWRVTAVSDEFLESRRGHDDFEEVESYKVTPNYGVLIIAK